MKVSKELILQKALHFFCTNDYDRATLNDIARALDITKGGIYHYFRSKDELFHDSVMYLMDRLDEQMIQSIASEVSLKEILEPFFRLEDLAATYSRTSGVDLLGEYGNLIYLLVSTLKKFPEAQSRIEMMYARFITEMETLFREAQNKGEIRGDLSSDGLAFEVAAFVEGGLLLLAMSGKRDGNSRGELVFDNFWKRIEITQ
jgi:AcrR family transcriptional regulator